jgi:transposase
MRPYRFVRPLSSQEAHGIEALFRRGANARTRRRAQAVRLSAKGYTVPEVADILGCTQGSVHNWLDRFESGGVGALADRPRSGRPPLATPDYRHRLVEAVKADPHALGYPFTVWTLTRLRAHMARELGVLLSESRVRQVMKEEGLVFKRPKHTLAKQRDPEVFREIQAMLDDLKKRPWYPVPQ